MSTDDGNAVLQPVEIELKLLSILLNHPNAYHEVAAELDDDGIEWMSHERRQIIFEAIRDLGKRDAYIDQATVADHLARQDKLGYIGGHEQLGKIVHLDGDVEGLPFFVKRVKGAAYYRELDDALNRAREMIADGHDPSELHELLTNSAKRVIGATGDDDILWGADTLAYTDRIVEEAITRYESNTPLLDWPWSSWNSFIEPLPPGTLALIAGNSGLGKTLVAEHLAEHWAKNGFKVVFFHFELNKREMMRRRLARYSGVEWSKLRRGNLTDDEILKIQRAQAAMDTWKDNIHYIHSPGYTAAQLASKVRKLVDWGECDVFIGDYLTKISMPYVRGISGLNPAQALGHIVEVIKNAAEEEPAVAGVILSQYNNEAGHVKSVWDLSETMIRNSGEPYQKSNLAIFMYGKKLEEDKYSPMGELVAEKGEFDPKIDCLVSKQTFGRPGKTELYALRKRGRIYDLDSHHQEEVRI